MQAIIAHALRLGVSRVLGEHVASAKNAVVADLFERLGFTPVEGTTRWQRRVDAGTDDLVTFVAPVDPVLGPSHAAAGDSEAGEGGRVRDLRRPGRQPFPAKTTAHDVPGWDSVGHLIFISEIESAFTVRLPMQASLDVADLDGLAALIRDAQR